MEDIGKILIVDDERSILNFFKRLLKDSNYEIVCVDNGEEATELIKKNYFDLIITDLRIGSFDGMELLKAVKQINSDIEVIIITGYGTIESAVESVQLGAYDYITKPLDVSKTRIIIHKALEKRRLKIQVERLKKEISQKFKGFGIIAISDSMRRVLQLAETIAPTDSTVLITGESGVGKEILAKYIHKLSKRAKAPFISINCAALPETLLESELFGYVKGAFTGAIKDKIGIFEEADGGTIFLDEVGELTLPIQAKLLRVLQEGEIRRLGATGAKRVNVRIISATNKNLLSLIKSNRFRDDLYYRLNVIPIIIPPLRERKEDIVPLAEYFLKSISEKMGKNIKGLTPEAIYMLKEYNWPGNVRELENLIERLIAVSEDEIITDREVSYVFDMDVTIDNGLSRFNESMKYDTSKIKREHIIKSLKESGWNIQKTANNLGISRTTLWRWMKRYNIKSS